jgi:hypothetical protein
MFSDSNYTDSITGALFLHVTRFPDVVPESSHTCLETIPFSVPEGMCS